MNELKRKEEKRREVKREGKARKVISASNILCIYAVGLLTLAIRGSVGKAQPDRALIFRNGARRPARKAEQFF